MTKEEFVNKLKTANEDIKKGNEIIKNLSFYATRKAEKYITDCRKNIDYLPYIEMNLTTAHLKGSCKFSELPFLQRRNILNIVVSAIEEYVLKISSDKTNGNK